MKMSDKNEKTQMNYDEEQQLLKGRELALEIAKILDEKKAHDIKIINVNEKTIIADYFVIATGNSRTQVNALSDEVEYKLGLLSITPSRIEGRGDGNWVILDFDSVLVHIFGTTSREFYKLEKLWADAEEVVF